MFKIISIALFTSFILGYHINDDNCGDNTSQEVIQNVNLSNVLDTDFNKKLKSLKKNHSSLINRQSAKYGIPEFVYYSTSLLTLGSNNNAQALFFIINTEQVNRNQEVPIDAFSKALIKALTFEKVDPVTMRDWAFLVASVVANVDSSDELLGAMLLLDQDNSKTKLVNDFLGLRDLK